LELRLQAARKMLADPRSDRLKVIDIAYASGFNEVSYFNRRFRQRFGEKPSDAREEAPSMSPAGGRTEHRDAGQ
jgi:transcriptional regulator GlxA family with amidase domain